MGGSRNSREDCRDEVKLLCLIFAIDIAHASDLVNCAWVSVLLHSDQVEREIGRRMELNSLLPP